MWLWMAVALQTETFAVAKTCNQSDFQIKSLRAVLGNAFPKKKPKKNMRGKKKRPKTVERKAAATEFQQKTLQGFKANNATAQQRLESNPIQLQAPSRGNCAAPELQNERKLTPAGSGPGLVQAN